MVIDENILNCVRRLDFYCYKFLTDTQKLVLHKRINQELTFGEIATIINRSSTQARNIFLRTLTLLRLFFNGKDGTVLVKDSLLSKRIRFCFGYINLEIFKISDFNNYPVSELLKLKNFGIKSIREIQEYIKDLGFSLKFDIEVKMEKK